jgi:predicted deacylase
MNNLRILVSVVLGLLVLGLGGPAAGAQTPVRLFVIGGLEVRPGEMGAGFLAVPEKDGVGTSVPVTVLHGAKPGPVLALVAGTHGYEYPPILALYRLKTMLAPRDLAGTLLLVHIANLPSFQKRTIYYNPHDWKNLNRVFPGDPNGTLTQRLADVLTREVVNRCDALIDMHCGDGNEALIPYSYWMISKDARLNEETKQMALAFGLPHIIIDDTRTQDAADSKYLGNTAILRGKPAVTTEAGLLGRSDEEDVQRNIRGVLSVMRLLKILSGEPELCSAPVWIDKYEVVYSKWDGLFHPAVPMGHYVVAGQKVGIITDYLGEVKEELKAPFSGVLLYIINTPPTSRGEPLFEVGRLKEK